MRIALFVLLLLISGGAVLSWQLGVMAEDGLTDFTSTLSLNPDYQAQVVSYERGFTHSRAEVLVTPDLSSLMSNLEGENRAVFEAMFAEAEKGFTVIVEIAQGPLAFKDGIYPGLYKARITLDEDAPWFRSLTDSGMDLNNRIETWYTLSYFGTSEINQEVKPFTANFGENSLSFGGLETVMHLGDFGANYDATSLLRPTTLISPDESLMLSEIRVTASGTINLPVNDAQVHLTMDSLQGDGERQIEILDLETRAIVSNNPDGTFDSSFEFNTGHIDATSLPEPVNEVRASMAARGMSVDGLLRFRDTYQQAMTGNDQFAVQTATMNGLQNLFEGSPTLEISEFHYSQGQDIYFDFNARLDMDENLFANPAVQSNMYAALNGIDLDMNAAFTGTFLDRAIEAWVNRNYANIQGEGIDPTFIEQLRLQQLGQTRAMVEQLTQAGYLVRQNDDYTINATLDDTGLKLNGNPMNLPFF